MDRRRFLVGLTLAPALACAAGDKRPLIYAAASLAEALTLALPPGSARVHFGGTATLARQIQGGAPGDLFISGDWKWIEALAQDGRLGSAPPQVIARNTLALVTAAGTAPVKSPAALAARISDGTITHVAVGHGAVPVGRYAREALEASGIWSTVGPVAVHADNVSAIMAWVERGELDAAVVYGSDARGAKTARLGFTFPAANHTPIEYVAAVLAGCRDEAAALALIDGLLSAPSQAKLAAAGLLPAASS